jgi:hypothetical protein
MGTGPSPCRPAETGGRNGLHRVDVGLVDCLFLGLALFLELLGLVLQRLGLGGVAGVLGGVLEVLGGVLVIVLDLVAEGVVALTAASGESEAGSADQRERKLLH